MRQQPEKCRSILLSCLDYGESDRIVSFFSLEHGRLKGFAKGARASRKRFGGLLEPGNCLNLSINLKQEGLSRIEAADVSDCYPELRSRLESLSLALYAFELVEQLTPEGQPLPRLYRLLSALLDHLNHNSATNADRRFYEINLLNILGYCPVMDSEQLTPLRCCLKTGRFGNVVFNYEQLQAAAGLLDRLIKDHCCYPLKSRPFMESLLV